MGQSVRRLARESVLKGLYAEEIGSLSSDEVLRTVVLDGNLSQAGAEFARTLFDQVHQSREWTDAAISRLATNWDIDRIAVIDRIIMRMAMTEIKVMLDIPMKVVLNEAIELAKRYSTSESSSFINGILDTFVKDTAREAGA
jgi:transcription antitermination protein NusB